MATVEKTVGKGRIFVNALPNPSNIKDIPLRAPASTKLSTTMATLGTEVVQKFTPINNFKVQVSTMRHVAGDLDRQLQCESYVTWLNEDMAQILLFDNVESESRLIGVEYSISDKLFQELPQEEKMMWAPKAWSVVNGIETLPRVMNMVEKGILDEEVHFYSKGWLIWDICSGKILPTGLPQLLVPFTGDGQVSKRLVDGRDDYWNVTTDKLAYSRQNLKFSAPLPGANDGMTPFQLAVVGAAGAMGAGAMGAGGMGSAGRGGMPQAGVGGYDSGYGQQGVGSQGYGQQGIGQSGYGTSGSGDVGQTGLGHTQAGYGQSGIGQSGIGHGAGVSQGGMGTQSGYGVGQGQSGYGGGVGETGAGYGSQAGLGQTGTGYGTSGLPGTSILGQGSQGVGSGLGHTGTGGTGVTGGIGSRLEEGAYDIARGSTSASRGY